MINTKEPKGAVYVNIETDENGEFRRLIVKTTHVMEVDINGITTVLSNSDAHVINYLPTDIDEVKRIIYKKLENTLKTVCDRADKIEKIINMLENIALGTGCDFDITVTKGDC